MNDNQDTKRARVTIAGRVQGVGFRYATCAQADARGVRGWARNLPDGRVEVVAEGPKPAVDSLIAWCRDGPRWARVHALDVVWEPPRNEPPGFGVQ